MNIKTGLKILLIVLVFVGCEDKTISFEYTMYINGNIWFNREPIIEKYKSAMENGDFLWDTSKGDTLMAGKYQNGFKVGMWKYHPSDSQTVYVNWEKYSSDDYSTEINYPSGWALVKSKTRPFQATFSTASEVKDDKYFIVLSHQKSELKMNLKEYWTLFNSETHSSDSITSYLLRKFSREEGDYYFSTYTIARNNEEMFLFSFLGETDSAIYDISYASLKDDIDLKYTIFLDMIRSLRVEGKRFFTPFEQNTKIIELQWPPEPEIAS